MARGWESKGVEQQQEERQANAQAPKRKLTPEQAQAIQRRETLLLSKKRAVQQLEVTADPNQRRMLELAIADLDAQLQKLDPSGPQV
jgi:hypothetical protein